MALLFSDKLLAPTKKDKFSFSTCSFFFFLILLFFAEGYAQTKVDSLKQLLQTQLSSEEQIKIEIEIVNKLIQSDPKSADPYLDILEKKLDFNDNTEFLILYYYAKSIRHRQKRNLDEAKKDVERALIYANKGKDSLKFKAKLYNSLGAIADDDSNIKEAVKNHLIALEYAKKTKDPDLIATVLSGLGRAYLYIPETKIAKEYYERAIAIKEENKKFDSHLAVYYNNLSICFDKEKKYDSSLIYINKSIFLKKKEKDFFKLISAYNNKAYTLYLLKRYKEAETNVKLAIKIADSLNLEDETLYPYATYSEILIAQNKLDEAEIAMNKSIDLSKKYDDLYLADDNLFMLYSVYNEKGNYKKALDYFKQRSVVLDSIRAKRKRYQENKLAIEYETEKKNKAITLLNAENEINSLDLKKSRQLQITFLLTALLAFVVIALLWSRHKSKVKTDRLIKEALEKSYEKKLNDTELQALRAQMNPHFLFNCLNSINSFIIKNEQEQASEYLSKFSMLIRKVLSNSKASKVTLADELEALELYIEMEALRLDNVFEYKITIGENVEKDYLEIPPLIIQPYVENSIWHGLLHKTKGNGKLLVDIQQKEDAIICTIEDNGIGREAAEKIKNKNSIKRKFFGMNITKERLEHINEKFKDATNVTVTDLKNESGLDTGTRVVIRIAI